MAEHGGYRAPANPAPVSGPGALSARTDGVPAGQVTGLPYGQNSALNAQAASGPMAQAPAANVVPLDAPSQYPDQPVTSGAPLGPGPGPSVMQAPMSNTISERLQRLLGDDIQGEIEDLFLYAEKYGL